MSQTFLRRDLLLSVNLDLIAACAFFHLKWSFHHHTGNSKVCFCNLNHAYDLHVLRTYLRRGTSSFLWFLRLSSNYIRDYKFVIGSSVTISEENVLSQLLHTQRWDQHTLPSPKSRSCSHSLQQFSLLPHNGNEVLWYQIKTREITVSSPFLSTWRSATLLWCCQRSQGLRSSWCSLHVVKTPGRCACGVTAWCLSHHYTKTTTKCTAYALSSFEVVYFG